MLKSTYTLMGIVNATPDSFYDGGRYRTVDAAVAHGVRLTAEGADILDIGGASSRPGAAEVDCAEELERVVPVIRRLSREVACPISVDTTSTRVACAALDAGATWVNDISAGRHDNAMPALVAKRGCTIVLMHSRATPQTMQQHTEYGNVVEEVKGELATSIATFLAAGVSTDRIVIDPGIGFAKTASQNVALLAGLEAFVPLGYPVLVGTSRKAFIGHLIDRNYPAGAESRLHGSLGSVASAFLRGARIFRIHDVAATRDFFSVFAAIEQHQPICSPKEITIDGQGDPA